jgi:hypothetical protein
VCRNFLGRASLSQDAVGFFIFFFVVGPLFFVFLQFGYRYVLTYRLTDRSVSITLFGLLPIFCIRYDTIEELERISAQEATFKYWHPGRGAAYGNRFFGKIILVRRKGKRPVLLTPDDAEEFMQEVRQRVYQHTGQLPLGS